MVRRPLHLHKHLQQAIADFAKDPVKLNGLVAKQRETLRKRHTDAEIADFEKRIHSGDVQINLDAGKRGHLRVWLERLPKLAEFLNAMQWQICKAKKGLSFITSDAPAYVRRDGFQHSDGIVGLVRADLGAKLYFPLSPKKFLIIGHESCEEKTELPKMRVRELNSQTIRMASRFIYSHEATQSTKDSILANNQFSPPVPNLNEVYK
jgi:hypothetical protein